jgi:hypothetical protein
MAASSTDVDIDPSDLSLKDLTEEEQQRGEEAMGRLFEENLKNMKTYTVEQVIRYQEMCVRVESVANDIRRQKGNVVDMSRRVLEECPPLTELENELPGVITIFGDSQSENVRSVIMEFLNIMLALAKGEISKTDALDNVTLLQHDGNEGARAAFYQLGVQLNARDGETT